MSLLQEEDTLPDLKENENTENQDKSSLERHGSSEFQPANMPLVTDGSAHCSSHVPFMTAKEDSALNDSVHVNDAATLMNLSQVAEQHSEPTTDRLCENIAPLGDPTVPRKDKVELTNAESSMDTEVVNNPGIIGKLKRLFGVQKQVTEIKVSMTKDKFLEESVKVGKKKLHQKKIAPVIIWDFGGQDVFYSTHQTFLTYRAIYLIVLDGSRNLDEPSLFEQYLPERVELKQQENATKTNFKNRFSFIGEVESRRRQLFRDIEEMFSDSKLLSHLVTEEQIFVNAKNSDDLEMANIKNVITRLAIKQPTWGQELPKCFIPLELEFDSLLNRNIPLITMERMKMINSAQPVRPLTEDELQVFLKFQHSVGRILHFEEDNLNQHIILAPTHLIDAFKSIVTDRRFCEDDRMRLKSWKLMSQKGVISKKSIGEIWKKKNYKQFQQHKEYLLGVMTHLDILVEPKRYDKTHKRIPAEFYYIASMVRTENKTDYLMLPNFAQRNIAIAFLSYEAIIPPALSFRFISYCLSIFAVKKYGLKNKEMLFHMSAVFTIDPSLDMCVNCNDEIIVVRLVHSTHRTIIMRDLASSIRECLAAALEKISQLYVNTSSEEHISNEVHFFQSLCCSSPDNPCILPMLKLPEHEKSWICHKHRIDHTKDVLSAWTSRKEQSPCAEACPVTDNEFLKQTPTDIHLLRLSMQYSVNETKEFAIHLGMQYNTWARMYETIQEAERLKFETLRRCVDNYNITFNDIRKAVEFGNIQNLHILCKDPKKWDMEPTEEHFDRLAPFVGNNSLAFLVELGMEFHTWEQIQFKQSDRDLVKLNRDILQEWKTFCDLNTIRPTLRHIGQAFNNIGKNIKIVENALANFF
ncbi:unnamed protein product [Mytilus edulis]|uniref:COR domain-containing protein n=1 Tax=Mytilus edulis TaxID=6550 RepID=A0A8S3USI6_MYTED|nr:unnamed protein product [Mytilus edulis]